MIDITEQDGELLIDGKPVDFQAPWKVEDAIRQLRAENEMLLDQMCSLKEFHMDGSGLDMRWSGDAAHAVMAMLAQMMLDVPNYLESQMTIAGHGESYVMTIRKHDGKTPHAIRAEVEAERDKLRADIAERDARITGLHSTCEYARQTVADLEAELARLRAQGPVAWMWNDMIGIPHTHISPTRPTWPDAGASSAMSVAIDVRPLYAEPIPAKVAE